MSEVMQRCGSRPVETNCWRGAWMCPWPPHLSFPTPFQATGTVGRTMVGRTSGHTTDRTSIRSLEWGLMLARGSSIGTTFAAIGTSVAIGISAMIGTSTEGTEEDLVEAATMAL